MNKKITAKIIALISVLALCLGLAACGGGSESTDSSCCADGTYTGRSQDYDADESGNGAGYGTAEIEIQDGTIVSCTFTMYELDGTVKDETYGADLSQENRLKAQKAVQAGQKYAASLSETGSLDEVDAITGATISYNEFIEAVNDALSQASSAQ